MELAAALAAWGDSGSGCALLLGSWTQVEQAAAAVAAADVPVQRLNRELLARLDSTEELLAAEANHLAADRTTVVRAALQQAFEAWLAELPATVAVRDLELLIGERVDLEPLRRVTSRLLLLVPGESAGRSARLFVVAGRPSQL